MRLKSTTGNQKSNSLVWPPSVAECENVHDRSQRQRAGEEAWFRRPIVTRRRLEHDDFWLNRPVRRLASPLPLAGERRPPSAAVSRETPKRSFGYVASNDAMRVGETLSTR